jgi:TonB family protein
MKQVNYLKSLIVCLALFCGFSTASAQDDQQVLDIVEQMPSFAPCTYEITRMKVEQTKDGPKTVQVKEEFNNPGGFKGLQIYLAQHVRYPVVAEENGIQGRVICTFVVEKDGSISDVNVAKSVDPSLDKEAVRVLKQMPKWTPGKQKGEPVRVKYTVPVTFRLQ